MVRRFIKRTRQYVAGAWGEQIPEPQSHFRETRLTCAQVCGHGETGGPPPSSARFREIQGHL